MQNFHKFYPNLSIERFLSDNLPNLKNNFRPVFPIVLWTLGIGFILLVFQVFLIGLADRFGVSPKLSFLVSSIFYTVSFGWLAFIGKSKFLEKLNPISNQYVLDKNTEAVCKLLIIKRVKKKLNQ